MSSRSLRFGYPKVAYDGHTTDWLNSSVYPTISFELEKLVNFAWHGKELRSEALGILKIKGIVKSIQVPLSTHYFRKERRKYEGKTGDLLRLDGLLRNPPVRIWTILRKTYQCGRGRNYHSYITHRCF